MPKATRDKETQEAPKKRSRKTEPVSGNGTDVAQPVTTAPAIAAKTLEVSAEKQTPKKRASEAEPANLDGTQTLAAAKGVPDIAAGTSEAKVAENPVPPAKHNGHVPEELVRRRAYELYLQRRGQGGSPEQDWFQALQEISGQHVA
jgi:hypothetical protein